MEQNRENIMTLKEAELLRLFISFNKGQDFITFNYKDGSISAVYQGYLWDNGRLKLKAAITTSAGKQTNRYYWAHSIKDLKKVSLHSD